MVLSLVQESTRRHIPNFQGILIKVLTKNGFLIIHFSDREVFKMLVMLTRDTNRTLSCQNNDAISQVSQKGRCCISTFFRYPNQQWDNNEKKTISRLINTNYWPSCVFVFDCSSCWLWKITTEFIIIFYYQCSCYWKFKLLGSKMGHPQFSTRCPSSSSPVLGHRNPIRQSSKRNTGTPFFLAEENLPLPLGEMFFL